MLLKSVIQQILWAFFLVTLCWRFLLQALTTRRRRPVNQNCQCYHNGIGRKVRSYHSRISFTFYFGLEWFVLAIYKVESFSVHSLLYFQTMLHTNGMFLSFNSFTIGSSFKKILYIRLVCRIIILWEAFGYDI